MITPFLAQSVDNVPSDWLKNCALFIGGLSATVYYCREIFRKKTKNQIEPQPLIVEIKKAMHEQFAEKSVFDDLVRNNTKRHGELFNKIDAVERQARHELEQRMSKLNEERSATLEKLNNQFTFIRENIASINTELKIRSE